MSTDYQATLIYCCVLPNELLETAIAALPEAQRDRAWEVVNDLSLTCNQQDPYDSYLYYIGQILVSGWADTEETTAIDELQAKLEMTGSVRDETLTMIVLAADKVIAPELRAFFTWFYEQVQIATSWGLRCIPSWG